MFGKKKNNSKQTDREEYFNNRDFRRNMLKKKKKSSSRFIKVTFLLFLLAAIGIGIGSIYLFKDLPSLSSLENPKTDLATRIYLKTAS